MTTTERKTIAIVKRASDRARRFPTYAAMLATLADPTCATSAVRAEVALLRVRAMLGVEI